MNIRSIGSYEIVLYTPEMKRVDEYVGHGSMVDSEQFAIRKVQELNKGHGINPEKDGVSFSYTVSKIVANSVFNNQAPKYIDHNKEMNVLNYQYRMGLIREEQYQQQLESLNARRNRQSTRIQGIVTDY